MRENAAAGRWTVAGAGHDHRLDVTLNQRDFATDMNEIRENGCFTSRHQAEAAARHLLAEGVEIGVRASGPTPTHPYGSTRP
ncbi:hypothetical protein [Kitasatospora sp. NPDC088783]|uniref:hypothetical protein n=1 Tax=Kitasatospora sp. NPDC088783 TaxID=3364077 RepID=UPI00381E91DD